jgi:hypothetical protein
MTVGGSQTTQTTTASDTGDSADTNVPQDMPDNGDGDGDAGDGDNSTNGDGDGDTDNSTTNGDGDGDTDNSTGDPVCGNGSIDDGEQCDGGNLGGFTCVDLGYSGGTLGCDPVTCTYDASACMTDMDGGSGTSG